MFSENEVRALEGELNAFQAQNEQHQISQSVLVEKYRQLLSDYKSLQNDHEETKEARDRYKKMIKGGDRSPFVLLLIDGDSYIFEESFVKAGNEGGGKAASLIYDAMLDHVRKLGLPPDCRVVVRILLNLQGVSSAFHRYGVCGSHARAIAPFTAGFSRAYELFDVVDCGERRESCEGKIKENFFLYAENASCRHIFFAGCHSNNYLPIIKGYEGRTDRVTLIKGAKYSSHYNNVRLNIEEFHGVFREEPLENMPVVRGPPSGPSSAAPESSSTESKQSMAWKAKTADAWQDNASDAGHRPQNSGWHDTPQQSPAWEARPRTDSWENSSSTYKPNAPFCTHWIRGICRYGTRCTKRHEVPPDPRAAAGAESFGGGRASVSENWRSPPAAAPRQPSMSYVRQSLDSDDASTWSGGLEGSIVAEALPRRSDAVEDLIPVNKDGYRLDFYAGPWDRDDAEDYQSRIEMAKPCNEYQLTGSCKNGPTCNYDHAKLSKRQLEILRQIVHDYPCRMRGACRKKTCHLGHLCYNTRCVKGRRGPGCRLDANMHSVDPHVSDWVAVEVPEILDAEENSKFEEGDLLGESFEDTDAPPIQIPLATRNLELTSQWAQGVLSPTPSGKQTPAPILSAVESNHSTPGTVKPYNADQNNGWGHQSRQSQDWTNANTLSPRWNNNENGADRDHESLAPPESRGASDETNHKQATHTYQQYHRSARQSPAPPQAESSAEAPVLDDDGPTGW